MIKNYKRIYLTGVIGLLLGAVFACSEEEPVSLAPTFNMNEASEILRTSATFSGSITGETSHIKEYGFDYSLSEDFTTNLTTRVKVGETLSSSVYQVNVKGLDANERYYYRMYATTGVSTVYSPSEYFQTSASSAPIMSALVVDSIGEDMARFRCTIEEIGDEYLIEYGVGYKTAAERTYYQVPSDSIIPVSIAGAENTFYIEISGLESATKYSFRPYAKNSADANGDSGTREGYGDIVEKQTANKLSAVVTTSEIMEGQVGINSVTVSGMVQSADGSGGKIDKCGFCWSATNMTPSIADSHMEVKVTGVGEYFSATIPDLQPGRTYYVRAYAQNMVDGVTMIGYGDVYEFTTTNLITPEIEWVASSDKVTPTTISIRANIKNYDGTALVEKGIIWDETRAQITIEEARKNNTFMKIESGENLIDATITNLKMNTGYYVRAYAIYQAAGLEEIGYTTSFSFRTQAFENPIFDNFEVKEISYSSAKLLASLSSNGNGTILERGFCVSLHNSNVIPSIEECDYHLKSDDSFISTITNLNIGTQYRVRAYVISYLESLVDTTYCWQTDFTTEEFIKPDFETLEVHDITYNSAKFMALISSEGNGTILERGFCISATLNTHEPRLNKCDFKIVSDESFISTINSLKPDTEYIVCPYIISKLESVSDTIYSLIRNRFCTNSIQGPDMYWDWSKTQSSITSIDLAMKIEGLGDGEIIERGFCWLHRNNDDGNYVEATLENNDGMVVADNFNEQGFFATATGLYPKSRYTFSGYVKVRVGDYEQIFYNGGMGTWTNGISHNIEFSNGTATSFELLGYANDVKLEGITEYGFVWSANDVEPFEMENQLKATLNEDGKFTAKLDNLESGKSYYVGIYFIYKDKKIYADGRWRMIAPKMPSINDNLSPEINN